ncbi:hypothetical protein [Chelativorans alearense]|uniref:hypothetical protein n=1 Tax=Chelativorans alearense TaxID=2681495 RepID=UPI0013D04F95|nr:hypothetical protein [Chelativorans alearense]
MVAGVVRELGINLGNNLGNNHEDPEFLPHDIDAVRSVVAKRNDMHDVWGWKMPHSSVYLKELLPDLRNPRVIVVFRNVIAIAESQMKRSDAHFDRAFMFSFNRLIQVGKMLQELDCPLVVVNYEKATREPRRFVDELASFLHIEPEESASQRAVEMINPEVGYRRVSHEDWRHSVAKAEQVDKAALTELRPKRRNVNISTVEGRLEKTNEGAFVEFSEVDGARFHLGLVRDNDPDFVRISVDVGAGYSSNMTERVSLFRGGNIITVEATRIKGIRIYPQFDGPWSNTKLFRVYS